MARIPNKNGAAAKKKAGPDLMCDLLGQGSGVEVIFSKQTREGWES